MRYYAPFRLLALVFLTVFLVASGCGTASKKPSQQTLKIAVCFADMNRDGNKIIKKVIDSRKKDDQADIIWLDAKNDQARQESQVRKLAGQDVRVVVLQPVNAVTGPDMIRGLVEKNIKVIALETMPADVPVDAYIASNHDLAGQLLVRFVVGAVQEGAGLPVAPDSSDYPGGQGRNGSQSQNAGQGQSGGQGRNGSADVRPPVQAAGKIPAGVMLISGDPGDGAAREIAAAARKAVQESPAVQLLADETVPGNDPSLVAPIIQKNIFGQNEKIQAVLTTDSLLAMAAVKALKTQNADKTVLTAGVGADEQASKALNAGDHDAEVDTRPDLLGQYIMEAALGLAKNGTWQNDGQTQNGSYSVPSRIAPVRLIHSENAYLLKQRWEEDSESQGEGSGRNDGGQEDSGSGGSNNGGNDSRGSSNSDSNDNGGSNGGSDRSGGSSNGGGKTTMLRITTQDGKTVEVQIDGEIKSIESTGGTGGQAGGRTSEGGRSDGGQSDTQQAGGR